MSKRQIIILLIFLTLFAVWFNNYIHPLNTLIDVLTQPRGYKCIKTSQRIWPDAGEKVCYYNCGGGETTVRRVDQTETCPIGTT